MKICERCHKNEVIYNTSGRAKRYQCRNPNDKYFRPSEIKILTKRKREYLGLPEINYKGGGRDFVRELIRARDNYTCKDCGKVWKEGMRRFDVAHLDVHAGKALKYESYDECKNNVITLCHKCNLQRFYSWRDTTSVYR